MQLIMFSGIRSDTVPVSFGVQCFCSLSVCQNILYNRMEFYQVPSGCSLRGCWLSTETNKYPETRSCSYAAGKQFV